MPVFNNALAGAAGSGGAAGYEIERSLRFNQADGAYLNKSIGGSATTFTVSCWVKLEGLNNLQTIFGFGSATYSDTLFYSGSNNQFSLYNGSSTSHTYSTAAFRDFSAWYHLHVKVSNGAPTLYVNGVETITTTGYNWELNGTYCNIGAFNGAGTPQYSFSGYMADFHCVEGQALDPSSFAETDADTGVWNPIKYSGTYGTNGFHLDFDPTGGTTYSNGVSSTSTANSSYPASNGFDGSVGSSGTANWYTQGSNETITVDLSSYNVTASNSVGFNVRLGGPGSSATVSVTATIGGTAYTQTFQNSSTQDQLLTFNGSGAVTTIVATLTQANASYGWGFTGVQVDGTYLVDYSAPGVDASGSGNHWTPNNLVSSAILSNVTQTVTISGNTSSGRGPYSKTAPKPTAGDAITDPEYSGSLQSGNNSGDAVTVSFNPAFTGVIYAGNSGGGVVSINGGTEFTPESNVSYALNPIAVTNCTSFYSKTTVTGQRGWISVAFRDDGTQVYNSSDVLVNVDDTLDSPTNYEASSGNNGGNYCVLNRLANDGVTLSNANLDFYVGPSDRKQVNGTIAVSSGKWYWEIHITSDGALIGIEESSYMPRDGNRTGLHTGGYAWRLDDGYKYGNNGAISALFDSSVNGGDLIGVALDLDAGTLSFYKNGSSVGTAFTGISGSFVPSVGDGSNTRIGSGSCNFGQLPFTYTPPTGYKSLCTQNLDDPLIAKGSTAFDILTWEGQSGSGSRDFRGLSFTPDLAWVKTRSVGYTHVLWDSVRGPGVNKELQSDEPNQEGQANTAVSGYIDAFVDGGFDTTAGTTDNDYFNRQSTTYVGWNWDGGDLATNSAYNQSEVWSNGWVLDSGSSWISGPELSFDGFAGTNTTQTRINGGATWTAGTAVPFTTSLRIWGFDAGSGSIEVNGTDVSSQVTDGTVGWGWNTITGITSPLSTIRITGNSSETTGIGAVEVDGKILVDTGVIPVGSLNSSVYDQSQTWSGLWSGTAGYGSFTNLHDADDTDYAQSTSATLTFPSAIALTSLQIRHSSNFGTATLSVNGTDVTSQLPTSGTKPLTTITGFTSLTSISMSGADYQANCHTLYEIFVNGKKLVDSGVSVTNVPSIASTTRANPTAGFSIVSFTADGTAGDTVGHGLNAKPDLIIYKDREYAQNWGLYHGSLGANYGFNWNRTDERFTDSGYFNNTEPTSLVATFGNYVGYFGTHGIIAYCFASVEGYSKIGSYVGNGSPDGPFVYCGFKPRWIMMKNAVTGGQYYDWRIIDTARHTYNEGGNTDIPPTLFSNLSDAEKDWDNVDILSNGFKIKDSSVSLNESGATQIFIAFAENPFKIARAR